MNFVADEGVDQQIVIALRENGHDVLYIAELASGINDNMVLQFTNEQNRILMTRDKDFGELVYRDKKVHSGIILNRLYELNSAKKAELVAKTIEEFGEELIGSFTVIQPGKIRIRKL
jgi:predicted nuclease of predicted toxin-antitoxin system